MRMLPHNWIDNAPRGDYTAYCDICDCPDQASNMVSTTAGRFVCQDCVESRDEVDLARETVKNVKAAIARRRRIIRSRFSR